MEKLRQRHRVEKQRATEFSGERFMSAWFYYEAMEAVENGSNTEPGSLIPGQGIRVKPLVGQKFAASAPKSNKRRIKPNPNFGAIRMKPSITPQVESGRPDLRPRKFSNAFHGNDDDDNGEMWIKVPRRTDSSSRKWRNENNSISIGKNLSKGKKKNNGGIADVVASIKLLGEGFMKVEKMKIDMAMEIEQMRMEMEMKRNRLMLESQKQIVDAFVEGLINCKKVSTTMVDL